MALVQYQFPKDLGNLGYYMTFLFSEYSRPNVFQAPQTIPTGGLALPMPDSINDHPFVQWGEEKFMDQFKDATGKILSSSAAGILKKYPGIGGASGLLGTVAGVVGYSEGLAINPFLVMLFKEPGFKEFKFSWTLMPRTSDESDELKKILAEFRKSMLPKKAYGALLEYPLIVKPSFEPNDYLFNFKHCAIIDINIEYSATGQAAFFKNTKAPVAVRLDIHLKEIDLWMRDDPDLM